MRFISKKPSKILGMFSRTEPEPHVEIHYIDRVEFIRLDGKKIGESKVEQIKCQK